MERRHGGINAIQSELPPRELWNFRPGIDEPLPTPVNDRGLVDTEKLVELVKSTVDPSFDWMSGDFHDLHHLYWPHNKYPSDPDADVDPEFFRNMTSNKVILPRKFHKVAHEITVGPPVPSKESMQYRKEAERVTLRLFSSGGISDRMRRVQQYDNAKLYEIQARQLEKFLFHLEAARMIPIEFQIVDLSDQNPESIHDMHTIRKRLGALVVRRAPLLEIGTNEQLIA